MDIEAAKLKLQAILNAARLRREGIEQQEEVLTRDVEPQLQPAVEPVVKPVVEPVVKVAPLESEETPTSHPHLFIEEKTPELVPLVERNGEGETITREVLSGRFLSTFRRRTPADGDQKFVLIPPRSRVQLPVEERLEWPTWGQTGRVDPRVAQKYDRPARGWSLNRNSGCMRADGSIEP